MGWVFKEVMATSCQLQCMSPCSCPRALASDTQHCDAMKGLAQRMGMMIRMRALQFVRECFRRGTAEGPVIVGGAVQVRLSRACPLASILKQCAEA